MPTSGIKTVDDVKIKFDKVKMRKGKDKLPYAVFKFNDALTEIVVDYDPKFYDRHYTYSEIVDKLPADAPRYFCYDFPHIDKDGNKNNTIVLVSWFPPRTPIRQKFVCGSSFLALQELLSVVKKHSAEGEDAEDISESKVCSNAGNWKVCPPEMCTPLPTDPVNIEGSA